MLGKTSEKGFGYATVPHMRNFLQRVRSPKRPTATVSLASQAALVSQLANLSLRSGRRVRSNKTSQKVEMS